MSASPLIIGDITLANPIGLAPMAGVTDRPFRMLCRRLGAGFAFSEMMSCNPLLRETPKSQKRQDHSGEPGPIICQIAGSDPSQMAQSAQENVARGAQMIDINFGCPAKKVLKKSAGSALMADPIQMRIIMEAVVSAVSVPVTIKMRTGPSAGCINAPEMAKIAEQCGVSAISIHGRTRDQKYQGRAEYQTISRVVDSVAIPVLANGDVDCAEKALSVLRETGAAGLLIGRAAQGNPWIFNQITAALQNTRVRAPSMTEMVVVARQHVADLHDFYGAFSGVRIARKHIGWYLDTLPGYPNHKPALMAAKTPQQQLAAIDALFTDAPANICLAKQRKIA